MKEIESLALMIAFVLIVNFLLHSRKWQRRARNFKSIINLVLLDTRNGHIVSKRIDLRDGDRIEVEELGLSFVFSVNEQNPEIAGLKVIGKNGEEYGYGLTMRSTTYTHQHCRFTALRHGESVDRAVKDLEADYFGTEEGPEFPPDPQIDQVALVADAPTWCFIFAERGTLEHVVLTPNWWRHLRDFFDEERMRTLPKARQIFWRAGVAFDEESDKPVNSSYRYLPTREEVQGFADRVGKTIALFVAHGDSYRGVNVERKFLVKPRKASLLQAPLRNLLRGFCVS